MASRWRAFVSRFDGTLYRDGIDLMADEFYERMVDTEGLYVHRPAEEAQCGATLDKLVLHAEQRHGRYHLVFVLEASGVPRD